MDYTGFQEEILDCGIDMFFTSADTFGRLGSIITVSDIEALEEPEDIIVELKEIWEGME